ncbi:HPr family phosphocarrier protein [candidate division KSB1 bacterium]|nr:HPr family phosphocarrier protein [candidate division KSB1 bacterium]
MIEKEVTISNQLGLHARPAALLVKTVAKFSSSFTMVKNGVAINGKSIMSVMALAAEPGSTLVLQMNGPDEIEAMEKVVELFENKFEED